MSGHFAIFHVSLAVIITMTVSALRGEHVDSSLVGIVIASIVCYAHRPQWMRRRASDSATTNDEEEFPPDSNA